MLGGNQSIPLAQPEFRGNEQRYVVEALDSGWVSGGPFVDRLEQDFRTCTGSAYAVATSNGTTALHLAYLALGLGAGDEIIVPGFAFMAAANVALHVNARPVFADVDPHTWCVTAAEVERRVSSRTKAIVPVHTYGNVCEMSAIMDVAGRHGISVIEDAAEAFGSRYMGRMAGTIGTIGTFSLHATKTITTGEGGMVVTDCGDLHQRMLLYRSHGMGKTRYWHDVAGHNFRLTNLQAAVGCAQLEQLGHIAEQRLRVLQSYRQCIETIPGVEMQQFGSDVEPLLWVVAVKLDPSAFPQGRDAVMLELAAAGVETRPGFYTPTRMTHLYASPALPISDEISDWVLVLPTFTSLTDAQIEYVCRQLTRARR